MSDYSLAFISSEAVTRSYANEFLSEKWLGNFKVASSINSKRLDNFKIDFCLIDTSKNFESFYDLKEFCRNIEIKKIIIFYSENNLDELYKYAKALIFPSFIEGYGWPPLEAAIHGCPVITTRTGAIEDLLGDYAKYVEADKQASIDQGVEELLRSPGDEKKSVALLSYEDCRRQYFNLYEQMMVN